MTAVHFRHRGHRIDVDDQRLVASYEDGVDIHDEERACTACGQCAPDRLAPDPCLGLLPGVYAACCGHGLLNSAYVARRGHQTLTGRAAATFFTECGVTVAELRDDDDPTIGQQLVLRSRVWLNQAKRHFVGLGEAVAASARRLERALDEMQP